MSDPHVHECKDCDVTWDEDVITIAVDVKDDHGKSSEWPFTCRCLDCGYVGWPNWTEIRDRTKKAQPLIELRASCPRSQSHQPMVRVRIDAYVDVPHQP